MIAIYLRYKAGGGTQKIYYEEGVIIYYKELPVESHHPPTFPIKSERSLSRRN